MITECYFDEQKDIQEVIPDLAVSIDEAVMTGVVKDTYDSTPYTKETDVNAVGSYLTDNIEVAMALQNIGKSVSSMPTFTGVEENK